VVSCNARFPNLFTGTHYAIELFLIEKPEMICVSNAEPSFKYGPEKFLDTKPNIKRNIQPEIKGILN